MKNALIICMFLSFTVFADEELTSEQLLLQSLEKINLNQYEAKKDVDTVSSWLTGMPTVQFSMLHSNRDLGADEYELSLNLPFKSRQRKLLDKELKEVTDLFKPILASEKALFVSGLIREVLWEYKIALKKSEIEQTKLEWLKQQQSLLSKLVQSGQSNLDLLFVESQILQSQLLVLEFNQQADMRLKQFQNMTGETKISGNFNENIITNEQDLLLKHPSVQYLQLIIQQSTINYELSGKASNPFNVSIKAVDTNAADASDSQYGVAFEMPIGMNKNRSQADRSSWLQDQNNFSNQLVIFERKFSTEFSKLVGEHQLLTKKQTLLEQQSKKTKQIFKQLEQLRNNNELSQGLYFQRMIELIATIHQPQLNQLYINQNQSRQNQLAGVSL